ncbi:hypothetical protein [Ruminococcus sp.]|uniref:hypothetical protein n=1 Tax=Ruminococcus sp. TaxID=41978 RepID=UPI0025F230BB|nr:hypothetical protein [Ruminococcus sp.]MBQ8966404.1 hypothetical protein [Ruminococcus sp.]
MKINEIKGILGDHVASGKPCLKMISCGEIMIAGLPYTFSMQNIGAESKGICVTISGDDVDSGRIRFTDLVFMKQKNGKSAPERYDFPLVTKKDGKKIYQARFDDLPLQEFDPEVATTKEEFLGVISTQLTFRVTPLFEGDDTPEVMLSVYPLGDPITGSATEWKKVTADEDYFLHKVKKGRGLFGRKRKK